MKKLFSQITCLVILASCNVDQAANHVAGRVDIDLTNRATKNSAIKESLRSKDSQDSQDKSSSDINSKYTQRDFAGCLTAAVFVAPVVALVDGLTAAVTKNKEVDLLVSSKSIKLVESDLKSYISKNGKITPDDFWSAMSLKSVNQLNSDLIKAYSKLSNKEFDTKKKLLAYAFLYFLEKGEAGKSYKFSFDDRENAPKIIRETISFAGSKEIKDLEEVGVCGYFRFSDIEVKSVSDNKPTIQCSGEQREVLITKENDSLRVKISTKTNPYDMTIDLAEVEFLSRKSRNVISHDLGLFQSPELKVVMNKSGNFLKKLRLKQSRASKIVLKNLKCRTFKSFDFE